jgi:uncharacterized protein YndB with AHSA1/START domain
MCRTSNGRVISRRSWDSSLSITRLNRALRRFGGEIAEFASVKITPIIEREIPHPPEKVWRALTQGPLIEEWLMKNDFQPVVGHRFNLRAEPNPHWSGVVDCEVLVVEPNERLSYSWTSSGEEAANGLKSIVTWTLTPTKGGVLVRMEQSGFRPEEEQNYQGANYGWQRFIDGLEQVVAKLDSQDTMLGRKNYAQEEIDAARAMVEADQPPEVHQKRGSMWASLGSFHARVQ